MPADRFSSCRSSAVASAVFVFAACLYARSVTAAPVVSEPDANGFRWCNVGNPGNTAYQGGPLGAMSGRGSVAYAFSMAQTEITTAQWMDFLNTFGGQPEAIHSFGMPLRWGAELAPGAPGTPFQWQLKNIPNAGQLPVGGMSWRTAALYCNWLHNGKPDSFAAIQTGAYDASTFTNNADGTFNDQLTRSPGAKYWIPSLDEWIKAVHFDPDRGGAGEPGWWTYPNGSDTPLIPGPPGVGQTTAGWRPTPLEAEWLVPLGAYPKVVTPWGLLDASGGTTEWTEEPFRFLDSLPPMDRGTDGAWAGAHNSELGDLVYAGAYSMRPSSIDSLVGFRVASAVTVPSPSCCMLALSSFCLLTFARKRNGMSDLWPLSRPDVIVRA